MDIGSWLGVAGLALLFGLIGVIPFTHRSCDSCPDRYGACPLDDAERAGCTRDSVR
jgi:hypothetical protein